MTEKYKDLSGSIPQDRRAEINEKILNLISSQKMKGVSAEDVFNMYTGIGGLHGLQRSNFSSYYEYGEAKKELENGQFFTPHLLSKMVCSLIQPSPTDTIADITCGMGNFFNYFKEENCYGCELDANAVKVAEFLYPKSHITCGDFKYYEPGVKFDFVVGNPPFNIRMTALDENARKENVSSQFLFFKKSATLMKPTGILLAIVPESFLSDDFFSGGDIKDIESDFNFVGQYKVGPEAFEQMGVKNFKTKVMCWQRKSEHIEDVPYSAKDFTTYTKLQSIISEKVEVRDGLKLKLHRELLEDNDNYEFVYKVNKYLYEIRTHAELQPRLDKALEYLEKFKTQKCPDNMEYSEWLKKHKITETMVTSYLRRAVKKQNLNPIDKVEFVKTSYGVKRKPYSNKAKRGMRKVNGIYWSFNDYCVGNADINGVGMPAKYRKLFYKKRVEYLHQEQQFEDMDKISEIGNFLRRFYFLNKKDEKCYFNKVQRGDLRKILQKDYAILAWQMGGGKTAASYCWGKFKPARNTVIVSTSLAINLTWKPFLLKNKERIVIVKSMADIDSIQDGDFILLSFHFISKYRRQLRKFMRTRSNKINFVFDESDEITNNSSTRTKAILYIFRKARRKILTTGTTTRNNIGELYSQLELLYNNSINMLSEPRFYYVERKVKGEGTKIKQEDNKYYMKPFPPYYGQTTFRRCFNPTKSSVFGVGKQSQDIYNQDELKKLISKTIITKKFREIAGDKYDVTNLRVMQDPSERGVYMTVINELNTVLPEFFNSTGNSRKDAMLRLMRQLRLLIDATSTPQMFSVYNGSGVPNKALKIFEKVKEFSDEKVAIGCTSKKGARWYREELEDRFPDREIFYSDGEIAFKSRESMLKRFEATDNGILIATQQSLKSSVNIPSCNKVIVESLQWNIPKIEQFYFRFIRYDSEERTDVFFINYERTIEVNLLALLMAKEKLNDFVKTLDYKDSSAMYEEFDIDMDILQGLITQEKDEEGRMQISWGKSNLN